MTIQIEDCRLLAEELSRLSPQAKDRVNELMDRAFSSQEDAPRARKTLQIVFGLDDLNWTYFSMLYQKKLSSSAAPTGLRIHAEGESLKSGETWVYPTVSAPTEIRKHLKAVEYETLKSRSDYTSAATDAVVWLKKMQAGTGSSMTRSTYLSQRRGVPAEQVKLGAKGTDLYVDLPEPSQPGGTISMTVAEAQIVKAIREVQQGRTGGVLFHDVVGPETTDAIQEIWKKNSVLDSKKTYQEFIESDPRLGRSGETFQSYVPTLDADEKVTFARRAPAGHALFFLDAIRAGYLDELRPQVAGKSLIGALANGEDLSSAPDAQVLGWMVKEKIPMALVTTEKTSIDTKGGILGLVQNPSGSVHLTVIETAQAKKAGQLALFEGLQGMASTNLTLINYEVLVPRLQALVKEMGEERFLAAIAPELIQNYKTQTDPDGISRTYLQLEGATGSSLMNLDGLWRDRYGEPLVHVMNVGVKDRTRFFAPIKFAFDYFLNFHSDRMRVNPSTLSLEDQRPGELISRTLKDPSTQDKYYEDVQNVLDTFEDVSVLHLNQLEITGQVSLKKATLAGVVRITNQSGKKTDLSASFQAWNADYQAKHAGQLPRKTDVRISKQGEITIQGE